MALQLPLPPAAADEALVRDLRSLRADDGGGFRALALERPDATTIAQPIRIYTSPLLALARGSGLDEAQPATWLYPVLEGQRTVGRAEVSEEDEGGGSRVVQVSQEQQTNESPDLERALVAAEEVAQSSDLELRVFKVAPLHLTALWLHGENQDWLIFLRPAPASLEPFRAYRFEEVRVPLAEAAVRQSHFTQLP